MLVSINMYIFYGIRFDACSQVSLLNGEWCKNVILGVGSSLSTHTDSRKKLSKSLVKVQQTD